MQKTPFLVVLLLLALFASLAYGLTATVWNDTPSYWTAGSNTALVDDISLKYSGTLSEKITISGGAGATYHSGAVQDWTAYSGVSFWWYGNGSNQDITFMVLNSSWTGNAHAHFVDVAALKGIWHKFSLNFSEFSFSGMTMAQVAVIEFTSLPNNNEFHLDLIELYNDTISTEVTSQMISTDWLTFGGLVFLCVLGVIFVFKSKNYLLNSIFGMLILGSGVALLGTNTVLSGWINLIAIIMGVVLMLDAVMLWRSG